MFTAMHLIQTEEVAASGFVYDPDVRFDAIRDIAVDLANDRLLVLGGTGGTPETTGHIRLVDLATGNVSTLIVKASVLGVGEGIAVDRATDDLYFLVDTTASNRQFRRWNGTSVSTVATPNTSACTGLYCLGDYVYSAQLDGVRYQISTNTWSSALGSVAGSANGVGSDETDIFFGVSTTRSRLVRYQPGSGTYTGTYYDSGVAGDWGNTVGVTADADDVYYSTRTAGTPDVRGKIYAADKATIGSAPRALFADIGSTAYLCQQMETAGGDMYYASNSAIWKIPLSTGTPELIAGDPDNSGYVDS